jgi:lysophospholipase L1-like esterase
VRARAALTSFAVLAGCGGGEPMSPPLPALAAPSSIACASTGTVVRIQLFGDSTMAGYSGSTLAVHTPQVALQADMDAMFGAGAVSVESRAVGSTNSGQLVLGTDGLNAPWPGSVDADIVVINHGINDAAKGVSPLTYRTNLEALAIAPARVVFETPNPVEDFSVAAYAHTMLAVASAQRLPLADTYEYVRALGGNYRADWAHPRDDLYQYIVRYSLEPVLVPIVTSLRCQ